MRASGEGHGEPRRLGDLTALQRAEETAELIRLTAQPNFRDKMSEKSADDRKVLTAKAARGVAPLVGKPRKARERRLQSVRLRWLI